MGFDGGRFTAPEGYNSNYAALVEALRFGPAIWGNSGALVMLFHIERTLAYGKASDQHSLNQAEAGCYSKVQARWIRGPSGVSRATFARQNARLADLGVLKRERRFTRYGGDAPTEYAPDWLAFRAAVAEWVEEHGYPSATPLLDAVENGGGVSHGETQGVSPRDTPAPDLGRTASEDVPIGAELEGGECQGETPPVSHGETHKLALLASTEITSKLDPPAVEKEGSAPLSHGGSPPPNPRSPIAGSQPAAGDQTPPNEARMQAGLQKASDVLRTTGIPDQLRAAGVREAILLALGFRLGPKSTIPARLVQLADRLQLPDEALQAWIHDWAMKKHQQQYAVQGPELLVTAAQTDLPLWCQKPRNAALIAELQRRAAPPRATLTQMEIPEMEEQADGQAETGADAGAGENLPRARQAGGVL